MKSLCLSLFLLLFVATTHAAVIPRSYPTDTHVQVAVYNPNQVYYVQTMQGYITTIQFGPDEKILSVNIGDSSSWLVNVQNDTINLKPTTELPDTNLNVLTSRGTYQFFLKAPQLKHEGGGKFARTPSPHTTFLLRFTYKDPLSAAAQAQEEHAFTHVENWNYTAQGDPAIAPICVYDNGKFTFFDFGQRKDIPAIFSVDEVGNESMINYHLQGKYVVVETTGKQFTLRNGGEVASVFNDKQY